LLLFLSSLISGLPVIYYSNFYLEIMKPNKKSRISAL